MPTILQINVTANSGSHGKIAEEVGQLAMENGWHSVIAYGRWANQSKSELIRVGSDFDVKEHGLESRLLDNHGLASRNATKRLVRQIEGIKPDIIHLHNIHGYYLNYRILFEYLNSTTIPVVWTLHDCWSFTGHCSHFVTAGCDKWKTQCFKCPLTGDYPKSYIDRSRRNYALKKRFFSGNNNLHIVTVCDWSANLVRQSFLKDCSVDVIKNGVDLDVFKPGNRPKDGITRILGVSGVWRSDKGLYDFYKLRKILDPMKYEITLIGLTRKQIKDLPQGIKGIARTESVEELVQFYSQADVYVNPTYADTFPTVNLESMACGTPVITYNTGGSPESISTETGWVLRKGDIQGMVEIIQGLSLKDGSGIMNQRHLCRKRAEDYFDKNKKYQDYLDLYNQLLAR